MPMTPKGKQILTMAFEECRLTAYQDPGGIWSVGWGHTGPDVSPGLVITQWRADLLLDEDLSRIEQDLLRHVIRPFSPRQWDAVLDLAYNTGPNSVIVQAVLTHHNAGDEWSAILSFAGYMFSGAVFLPGLARRRVAEAAWYTSGTPLEALR
jgi:lysozyme